MSDAALRELERRWKETGDPEDGARWLAARVRVGTLEPDRLLVLADCAFEPARRALGPDCPPLSAETGVWFRGLQLREKEPLVVLAVTAARAVVDRWPAARAASHELRARMRALPIQPLTGVLVPPDAAWDRSAEEPAAQLAAAEAWLACPCDAHRRAASDQWEGPWTMLAAFGAAAAAARAAAAAPFGNESMLAALSAISDAGLALVDAGAPSLHGIDWAHASSRLPPLPQLQTVPALLEALRAALREWALA